MTHTNRVRISRLSLGLIAALAAAPVFAQSTSAGVSGTVLDASGQPVAGAEVTITHVESGTVSRATTDASGNYTARGLLAPRHNTSGLDEFNWNVIGTGWQVPIDDVTTTVTGPVGICLLYTSPSPRD